ncbi:hypothetical protein DPEC_G00123240 [Dallia pectoralis]|uniref:Uncharacterized protein n=1 Tax=Dallia pectoralis TaxID=75939 RepID=A0ACC2GQD7_DALPE|nr:hypothetical protein DPEC_G00123240 [Dallia pectoralis]
MEVSPKTRRTCNNHALSSQVMVSREAVVILEADLKRHVQKLVSAFSHKDRATGLTGAQAQPGSGAIAPRAEEE